MTLRTAIRLLLGLAFAVALAPTLAVPAAADPAKAELEMSEVELQHWRDTIQTARQRVVEARTEVAQAEYAYQDWAQRRRPRGAKKADIVARLDAANRELSEAEAALPGVVEEARRAGLPPGELRELED